MPSVRRPPQKELERLTRALRMLSGSNRALLRAEDEAALLREICRVVVEEAGYRDALVLRAEHDVGRHITLMARYRDEDSSGFDELTWGEDEHGRSATGTAIRTGQPCVVNNLDVETFPAHWREFARRWGFHSLLSLPLRVEGQVYGALTIAAPEPDAFDETELQLLKETAEDLEFGIGVLRSRGRIAAAEETARRLAFVDTVTGLPNRVRLRELLAEAIDHARDQRRPLALLRIEIERFRELNETLGDVELDKLLQGVARRLEGLLGGEGRIARIAEDEFAVVLPGCGAEAAADVARRLSAALAEPIELHELLLDTRSAVGIALFPGHGADADALMRRASIALDQAKRSGCTVSMFREGQDRERKQRLSLIGDLRRAVVRDELRLYCQPQMHLASGRVCGAEALVRWNHPRLGMINPGEFIKLAESGGIITPLTYWVLDAALRQRYEWQQQGIDQTLSVNLSARDLHEPKLIEHISDALATWGARPGWLEIELTESALMEDPAGALETLRRLKRHDVRLAVDDFGTGYSSLAYLQRLPVDEIKIDQSFVSSMISNADSETIVRSTIDLAHNLKLLVVAEGVEDQRTFDRLAELGCDRAQGYCISRPIPAAEFGEWQARQ